MRRARGRPARLHPTVWAAGLVSLLTDVASEMVYPVLPLLLTTLGAPATALGLIEGTAQALAGALRAPAGWWSDRLGRRKPLMVVGYALSNLTRPLFALVTAWPQLLLLRAVDRLGKGLRGAPRDALLADVTPPEARGRAFGLHRALDTIGAVLGPLWAWALLAGEPGGYDRVFLWAGLPAALAVAVLWLGLREPPRAGAPTPGAAPPRVPGGLRAALAAEPRLRRLLGAAALFALADSSDAFLLLRARQLGLSEAQVPLAYLLLTASHAALAYPLGALGDRVGRRAVLVGGYVGFAAVYAGFALARGPLAAWPLLLAYGAYYAATEGVLAAYAADLAPPGRRAAVIGAVHALQGLGALPASLAAGALWDAWGPAAALAADSALALAAAGVLAAPARPPAPATRGG